MNAIGSEMNAIPSQMNAIGSEMNAIPSQMNAIGSEMNAIGSEMNAIGSEMSAIGALRTTPICETDAPQSRTPPRSRPPTPSLGVLAPWRLSLSLSRC
jgi:hypothetical protein